MLKRILIGILIAVAALILLLFASIAIDAVASRGRIDGVANTVIPGLNGGPDVRAYVSKPQGAGLFPVVIMIHEFMGLNEAIISRADLLAEFGYFAARRLPGYHAQSTW